jgi:hypothetical protein
MVEINIDPAKGPLSYKIESKSLQVIGYDVQLIDVNHNSLTEFNGTLGTTTDNVLLAIGITPDKCIDGFLSAVIEIADPVGAGNNYEVDVSVFQAGVQLTPTISLTGKTTDDEVSRYPTFHINKTP